MAGVKRISKRAAHKAAVEARKTNPVVKVVSRRKRKNPARLAANFWTMASEQERAGVLMTRVERKPPRFFLEHYDANSERITGALSANPKGQPRGWALMLAGGGIHSFKTKMRALRFFSRLEKLPAEVAETPVEDEALADV